MLANVHRQRSLDRCHAPPPRTPGHPGPSGPGRHIGVDEVELLEVPKGDHFIVVDPGAPHWAVVDQALAEALR